MSTVDDLAELYRDRQSSREEALWEALMTCHECDHRMIDHDEVAFVCRECRCDQSHRGLSAYADERLMDLNTALRRVAADPGGTK